MIDPSSQTGGSREGGTVQDLWVFTTVARNYFTQALVLCRSIAQLAPTARFRCFVLDGYDSEEELPELLRGRAVDCRRLGVPAFEEMAFKYSVTEFATSLKPHIFRYLFDHQHATQVVFLDPDTKVYSGLDWVADALVSRSILLTPHVLEPGPYMASFQGPRPALSLPALLFAGSFNTGFVALRNDEDARAFVEWWADVLKDHSLHRYCYDQKWVELVPVFWGSRLGIVKDPGANVAFWNLHERQLTRDPTGRYLINGTPLRFFHFTKIRKFRGVARVRAARVMHPALAASPAYVELYDDYIDELLDTELMESPGISYRFNFFDDGTPVTVLHRRVYANLTAQGEHFDRPFARSGRLFHLLESKGLIRREGPAGRAVARASSWTIQRLMGSEWPFRVAQRLMGPRRYVAMLKRLEGLVREQGQSMRWMSGCG